MTTPEITRRQAWMKLAVLIADGLPEPRAISFDRQGPMVDLDTAADFDRWVEALRAADTRDGEPFVASSGTLVYGASADWHGMKLALNAHVKPQPPEPVTEDLSKVRALAADEEPTCVCCSPSDCGDRKGHVEIKGTSPDFHTQCNCGRDWPCELAS